MLKKSCTLSQLVTKKLLLWMSCSALIIAHAAECCAVSFNDKRACCFIRAFLQVNVNTLRHARRWVITFFQTNTHTRIRSLTFSHLNFIALRSSTYKQDCSSIHTKRSDYIRKTHQTTNMWIYSEMYQIKLQTWGVKSLLIIKLKFGIHKQT